MTRSVHETHEATDQAITKEIVINAFLCDTYKIFYITLSHLKP